MNNTYYKMVKRYKDRLFSMNGLIVEMDLIISKQKREEIIYCVEYVPGRWTLKPRLFTKPKEIGRQLYVYSHQSFFKPSICEVWSCEVKNSVHISDGMWFADGVKLIKQIS